MLLSSWLLIAYVDVLFSDVHPLIVTGKLGRVFAKGWVVTTTCLMTVAMYIIHSGESCQVRLYSIQTHSASITNTQLNIQDFNDTLKIPFDL